MASWVMVGAALLAVAVAVILAIAGLASWVGGAGAPENRPGHVCRDDCEGCPEMVVIPAGEFMMGSPASEENRQEDEGPQHRVTVSSFALGVTEVTLTSGRRACAAWGATGGTLLMMKVGGRALAR